MLVRGCIIWSTCTSLTSLCVNFFFWCRLYRIHNRRQVKGFAMTATEILKHEHQVILMVLKTAENEARSIKEKNQVRPDVINKLTEFFQNFADRCHHAKEEKYLFERMRLRGIPVENGPIGVMLIEHDEGRGYVKAIIEGVSRAKDGDAKATSEVADHLLDYVDMLRVHIDKEDNVLYPLADRVLTSKDQEELLKAFEKVENEEIGAGVHEKYHQLAHELAGG